MELRSAVHRRFLSLRQPVLAERGELDREVDAVPQQAGEAGSGAGEHAFPNLGKRSDGTASGAGTLPATMPEPFTHVLRVRYGECDPQGVVFNANYFAYFDIALTELWRESVGPYTDMIAAGVDMVVAEASARYLAPAVFDEELAIDVAVTRLGTTSMGTRIAVLRHAASGVGGAKAAEPAGADGAAGGGVVVEGTMRHVFIDARTRLKTEIPPEIRRGLERHLVTEAETWSTSG
jgi:acyl-CoA thioester hydrolase